MGCRTNQYEIQGIREKFTQVGWAETKKDTDADLFVLNTCTVTAEADRKSKILIRAFHRKNPEAKIAVTGCYATASPNEVAELDGVAFVIPNDQKSKIVDQVILESAGRFCGEGDQSEAFTYEDLEISSFSGRARAFIKVQDGCDHKCSYCKVVQVRGSARSRKPELIQDEVVRLVANGYSEIVLTGIQLGSYGDDWQQDDALSSLLALLNPIEGLERIRLSSIDPSDITETLAQTVGKYTKICPHFHLPLQSGNDEILKRMKRAYRMNQFMKAVKILKDHRPETQITTDLMTGFPGETEAQFQDTIEVVRQFKPLRAHVFPFSPREGTVDADLPDQIERHIAQVRARQLEVVCDQMGSAIYLEHVNSIQDVLIESVDSLGNAEGHSPNFLRVRVREMDPGCRGQIFRVQVKEALPDCLLGERV